MVKIRLKNKHKFLNEDLSKNNVSLGIHKKTEEQRQKEISNLWGKLIKKKKLDLRKLYKHTMANSDYRIPLSKMTVPVKVKITDAITGTESEDEIIPAEIASFCEMARTTAMNKRELGVVLNRFNKPLIWSFAIDTAASDGVNIAFNPIFAQELLYKGKMQVKEALAAGKNLSASDRIIRMARLFIFVLFHESYHQLYRHREQAERKKETEGGRNFELSNVAMDVEINRDIEKQYPQWFAGATDEIQGMFDDRFRMEPWTDIFDAYFYKKLELPRQVNSNPINNQNSMPNNQSQSGQGPEDQSNNQQGQSGQGQGNQNQSGQNQSGQNQSGQSQQGQSNNDQSGQDQQSSSNNQQGQSGGEMIDMDSIDQTTLDELGIDISDITSKSKEYQDAYNDELQKELDKMNGKQGNSSNNQQDSNSTNSDDQSGQSGNNSDKTNQDNKSQQGSGSNGDNQNDDKSQQGSGSNGDNQNDDKSQQGTQGQGNQQSSNNNSQNGNNLDNSNQANSQQSGSSMSNDASNSSDGQMSPTEKAAREQARKDIKKVMDALKGQVDSEMNKTPDQNEMQKQLEGKEFNTTTSSTFGGADMLSQEQMSQLAEGAGQAYSSSDLTCDVNQLNADYNKENKNAIANINPDLANKLNDIANKLKQFQSLANWKQKLKKHFHDAMESSKENVRSKRVMSQSWRDDRFNPYKEREVKENDAANIFYLIDNSGSMYAAGGDNIFLQIFKEVVTIEKSCKVLTSARAYFTSGRIQPEDVELWDYKTPVIKILDKLGDRGGTGGTDIPGNVLAVTKLKKPYYYNNSERHTTIIVFTDGEDYSGWDILKKIPSKIRKDIVFVLINNKQEIMKSMQLIMEQGISLRNILGINTNDYKNK